MTAVVSEILVQIKEKNCIKRECDLEEVDVEVIFEKSCRENEGEEVNAQQGDEGVDKSFNLREKNVAHMSSVSINPLNVKHFQNFGNNLKSTWSGEVPTK